jgi:dienelactone hydrolase
MTRCLIGLFVGLGLLSAAGIPDARLLPAAAAQPQLDTSRGDAMIDAYFRAETFALRDACLAEVKSLADWEAQRGELRRQLLEMLGLDPLPQRTDLKAQITGTTEHDEFTVERLHFQSRPGLYVTANLYLPKQPAGRVPAILYLCGHGPSKRGNISFGNKVTYQHHGAWFARHGYACLVIDSLQLGEIEALHHGTYREGMWWWNARGYSPAGVEAWNCLRAVDYLQTRPEVDPERIGATGRSGGGAYSWWIAAIDERIKAAVPVAGITDLENHVVDGVVEGHCDCMYFVNTYRWDYPQVAALVAPRALLISNTDKDPIFPLEGVARTHALARGVYRLHNAGDKLGLQITEGGHNDTQELHLHAFVWFNRFLKDANPPIDKPAEKVFEPDQLRVFEQLPADQINTRIQEVFVPLAPPPQVPASAAAWAAQRDAWRAALEEKSFRAWPAEAEPLAIKAAFSAERQGLRMDAYDFASQGAIRLRLYVVRRAELQRPELVVLNLLDEQAWPRFLAEMRPAFETELKDEVLPEADAQAFEQSRRMFQNTDWAMAYLAPRGVGPTAWNQTERKQTQIRRRFMMLGQTLDGTRVWDARRGIQAVRSVEGLKDTPLWLQAHRQMAGVALYAALFEPRIARLELHDLPASHHQGPIFLNVLRYLDMPAAVAMAAERSQVVLYTDRENDWSYPGEVGQKLGWDEKQFRLRAKN